MRCFPFLLALLYGTSSASANEVGKSQLCAESVSSAIALLSFSSNHSTPDPCTNRLRTYSIYAAVKLYCLELEIEPGLDRVNKNCENRPRYSEIEPNLTDSYVRDLRVVDFREVPEDKELDTVVLISKTYFDTYYRTIKEWSAQAKTRRRYGYATYWFWGVVLVLGSLNRFYDHVSHSRLRRYSHDVETHWLQSQSKSQTYLAPFKYVHHWVRTHLIIPAAFGSHRQQLVWWCTIPTRMEAIVAASYFALNIILSCSTYGNLFAGNAYYDDPYDQFWRYFSDRTGVLSYANLPLLWLFGGRNNIFLWATGWSFSTFNLFHRAVARVATIQAIAHSIGYTILTIRQGSYSFYWTDAWWYMGVVATMAMALLLGFSSVWLRRHYYEIFLVIHIALSTITIVGLFVHTSIFVGEYEPYLWPIVAIWCFDRFARLIRLVCCNTYLWLNRNEIVTTQSAISYSKEADIIRLEIVPGSPIVRPESGQHYYLYQPRKLRGYENHPFTLGSWTVVDNRSGTEYLDVLRTDDHSVSTVPHFSTISTESERPELKLPLSYKFIFWIRPFDGWTRGLRDECSKYPEKTITTANFLIEGPYGMRAPADNYENVIFIAGGTGIAAALPYIEDLVRRSTSASNSRYCGRSSAAVGSSSATLPSSGLDGIAASTPLSPSAEPAPLRTRNVTLIWAARQSAFIHDLTSRELRPILQQHTGDLMVDARFYSTDSAHTISTVPQHRPRRSDSAKNATEATWLLSSEDLSSDTLKAVDIEHGRPDIKHSILRAVVGDVGRTAVLVCGPAGMADEARVAVHQALKGGAQGVDYFEETFGW